MHCGDIEMDFRVALLCYSFCKGALVFNKPIQPWLELKLPNLHGNKKNQISTNLFILCYLYYAYLTFKCMDYTFFMDGLSSKSCIYISGKL